MATPCEWIVDCPFCSWMEVDSSGSRLDDRLDSHIEGKHTDKYDAWAERRAKKAGTRGVALGTDKMTLVNEKYLNKCWVCQGPADTCTKCASKAVEKAGKKAGGGGKTCCGQTQEECTALGEHAFCCSKCAHSSPAPANSSPAENAARPDERAMIGLPDGGLLLTSPDSLPKPPTPETCDLCDGEGRYLDAFHMNWILCGKCGGTVETRAAAAALAAAEAAPPSPTSPARLDESTIAAVEKRAALLSDALTQQELLAFLNEVRTMQADNRSMRAEGLEMTKMLARIVEAHAGARSGDEREAIMEAAVWFRRRGVDGQDEPENGGEKR